MNEKEDLILNYLNEEISDIPIIVHNNLIRNNVKINSRSELEEIKQYIDDFLNGHTSNRFIALPGIRGVGKTTLLYEAYHYLIKEKNVPPNNILYFSCDELNKMVNSNIKETIDMYLKKKHDTKLSILNKQIFILIDEAHYDKNWALSGKIIYDKTKNIFMIFTGLSSLELESNTDASRRMNKEVIKPLNYGEHLRLKYNITSGAISESLQKLVFEGNETDAIIEEEKINSKVINSLEYTSNDWELYLKYGGFPVLFDEINMLKLKNKMVDMINKVVTEDIGHLKNISEENKINAQRILRTLAETWHKLVSREKK